MSDDNFMEKERQKISTVEKREKTIYTLVDELTKKKKTKINKISYG